MSDRPPPRPRNASFRFSPRALRHLDSLEARLGRSRTDITELAYAHLLATLERDERVHLAPPSDGPEEGGSTK